MRALVVLLFTSVAVVVYAAQPFIPTGIVIPAGADSEVVKDAGNAAISNLLAEFTRALPNTAAKVRRFAVMPLQSDLDSGYFTMQLRNQFTTAAGPAGFELYTPRETDEWESLLNEIKWNQGYADVMNQKTVQKFGRIKGIQGLIHGRIVSVSQTDDHQTRVRVSIQAFEVETGRNLWGKEVTSGITVPPKFRWTAAHSKYAGMAGAVLIAGFVALRIRRSYRPR